MIRTAAAALLLAATAAAQAQQFVPIDRELVASGLTRPLFVTHAPNDYDRIFILEQPGRIRILDLDTQQLSTFLDITSEVRSTASEQGLTGLAFHPDYESNGLFYIAYTAKVGVGDTRIAQYSVNPNDPDDGLEASEVILLQFSQPFDNHNGGWLGFSPTDNANFLYFASGDGGDANDPNNLAQNINELYGKILRFDVDNSTLNNAAPAPGNPFIGIAGNDFIWHTGLRNPWRPSFDRETGDLYIADVGQGAREEVSIQPANPAGAGPMDPGYQGGLNFGWRCMEGFLCTGLSGCTCNAPVLTLPAYDYVRQGGPNPCSVTGGYVYRGCAMPEMQGTYFFGDFCSGDVWSAIPDVHNNTLNSVTPRDPELNLPLFTLSSFGEDAFGELYVTLLNQGEVWRIIPGPGYSFPDVNNNNTPDTCECIADVNDDLIIDLADFNALGINFGTGPGATLEQGDINGDGFVDLADFNLLGINFGNTCN